MLASQKPRFYHSWFLLLFLPNFSAFVQIFGPTIPNDLEAKPRVKPLNKPFIWLFKLGYIIKVHIAVYGNPSQSYGALPYGITQCYLPPDISECAPP